MACIITGANSGIGKAAALQLAQEGMVVVMGCRTLSRGEDAADWIRKIVPDAEVYPMKIDLSSFDSINSFACQFMEKFECLDVLIHNAANFDHGQRERQVTEDGFESIFTTNHLGPFYLSKVLISHLKKSEDPRIITVGTRGLDFYMGTDLNFDDLQMEKAKFSVAKAYYNSKLAHLMYTLEFARRFEGEIKANCVRVTNVCLSDDRLSHLPLLYRAAYSIKKKFSIKPANMAKTYTYLATTTDAITGRYLDERQRIVKPPKIALDVAHCRKLWNLTEDLLYPWSIKCPN